MDQSAPLWERLLYTALGALGTIALGVVAAVFKGRQDNSVVAAILVRLSKVEADHEKCVLDHAVASARAAVASAEAAAASAQVAVLTERLSRLEQPDVLAATTPEPK